MTYSGPGWDLTQAAGQRGCSVAATTLGRNLGRGRGGEGGELPLLSPPSSHTDTDIICNALFSVRTGQTRSIVLVKREDGQVEVRQELEYSLDHRAAPSSILHFDLQ